MKYLIKKGRWGEGWKPGDIVAMDFQAARVRLEVGDIVEYKEETKKEPKEENLKCDVCGFVAKSEFGLTVHKRKHKYLDIDKCEIAVSGEAVEIKELNENAERIFKEVVSKIPFKYWVSAGTALGLYRDKEFIKGDTDLDFSALGYFGIDKEIIKILEGFKLIRKVEKGRPMQLAFIKDGVVVDFFFHWEEDGKYVNYNENKKTEMELGVYNNLEEIETKYGKLPFPNPIEKYLITRYGENWKTPKEEKGV
jgi:hypothetical protein